MSDYSTWRAANPDAPHFAAYQAGYEAARKEAADNVSLRAAQLGRQECCGHGTGYGVSPPECCADPYYMIADREAVAAIMQPLPAPPKEQG